MLEVGREYAITVNVFDKLNHRISVTEVRYLYVVFSLEYLRHVGPIRVWRTHHFDVGLGVV